jgi:hypothetical protein
MGAFCAGYINQQFILPVPLPGWYNLNASLQVGTVSTNATLFDLCPDARGLKDRVDKTCVVPCEPSEACVGANVCARQYTDKPPLYRCSSCAREWRCDLSERRGAVAWGALALPCPRSPCIVLLCECLFSTHPLCVACSLCATLQPRHA